MSASNRRVPSRTQMRPKKPAPAGCLNKLRRLFLRPSRRPFHRLRHTKHRATSLKSPREGGSDEASRDAQHNSRTPSLVLSVHQTRTFSSIKYRKKLCVMTWKPTLNDWTRSVRCEWSSKISDACLTLRVWTSLSDSPCPVRTTSALWEEMYGPLMCVSGDLSAQRQLHSLNWLFSNWFVFSSKFFCSSFVQPNYTTRFNCVNKCYI